MLPPRLSVKGGESVSQYKYQLFESHCRCGSITLKRTYVMEFTHPLFHRETNFRLALRSHHSGMREKRENNQKQRITDQKEEEKKPMTKKNYST